MSPLASTVGHMAMRLMVARRGYERLLDRLQLLLPFLLLISASASLSASPPLHHHFGWKSNPHHARGLTQFVHHPAFQMAPPLPDIIDLSGCMPDSGTVSAPLAVHMPAIYLQTRQDCTGNAGTGAIEFLWHKTFGVFLSASRLGLYTDELIHDGNFPRDAGSYTSTIVWVLQNQGIGKEDLFPYNTTLGTPLPDFYVQDAALHRTLHAYDVDATDHVSIQNALANGLPVMFGGFVYGSIETLNSDDYFNSPHRGDPLGGHERLICGYTRTLTHTYKAGWLFGHDTTVTGFYWVRNSWGTGWGCNGYCWEPMSEIENPQVNEDFAVVDVAAPAGAQKVSTSTGGNGGNRVVMMNTDADGYTIANRTEPERPEVWALQSSRGLQPASPHQH